MPSTPSYCPVRSEPIPATARPTGSTTQPQSRAADQIVAIPQLGPQTCGTPSEPPTASRARLAATGQSGSNRSRRPDGAAASRSLQNSDTIVTIVQPTCSGLAAARFTRLSACSRRPAAVRTPVGRPCDRQTATRSDDIARSRSRTALTSGQRIAAVSTDSLRRRSAGPRPAATATFTGPVGDLCMHFLFCDKNVRQKRRPSSGEPHRLSARNSVSRQKTWVTGHLFPVNPAATAPARSQPARDTPPLQASATAGPTPAGGRSQICGPAGRSRAGHA